MSDKGTEVDAKTAEEVTVDDILKLFEGDVSLGEMLGLTKKQMEVLYALAYTQYNAGKYDDAEKIFRALCAYDSAQVRYWLGLGGSLQSLKRYHEAAEVYAMGAAMSGLKDPEPMFYAAQCMLRDQRSEEAVSTLEFIEIMGRDNNAHDLDFKQQAQNLLNVLKSAGENKQG